MGLGLLAVILLVAIAPSPRGQSAPTMALQPCKLPDIARPAQCGEFSVLENRADPRSRTIQLNVAVLALNGDKQPDPIVFLAGGPGQGAVAIAPTVVPDLIAIAPDRDIILIDQRGTGRSHALPCQGGVSVLGPTRAADLVKCRAAAESKANLDYYGTDESVDDIVDVVRALGHTRINIVAASYGTRLAHQLMQRHPALVRSAVLRAAAPHDFNVLLHGGNNARAALERLFADCAAEAACHAAFPALADELYNLRRALRESPPVVGGVTITLDLFDRTLYALMLNTQTRQMLPLLIHSAAIGQMDPLASVAASIEAVYNTVSVGAYLSVICREDAPQVTAAQRRQLAESFAAATDLVVAACQAWPIRNRDSLKPKPSTIPTLVLSGELDPAMPPAVAVRVLDHYARGTHVILPATAHGPMLPGCAVDLAKSFIASAGTKPLDTTCLARLTRPPFRLTG
jgi:pimeloyl-ACP methyl ester carboxylesterase